MNSVYLHKVIVMPTAPTRFTTANDVITLINEKRFNSGK
jgi:hypothetical protein